jgi:nicotinate-nucleotide--dimethylbenzimidazole phosphoribosyltransferase
MGVIGNVNSSNIISHKLMEGTNNFAKGRAMSRDTAEKAIEIGISLVQYASEEGYEIIGTGEVGIGNTSSSSACAMCLLNINAEEAVGKGAGLTNENLIKKKEVIGKAVALHAPYEDEIDILSKVGGLDIAGLTGLYLGAAIYRKPIVIDGFISAVAALMAYRINPLTKEFMIPSHMSLEPGYKKIIEYMGLEPMLNLKMKLGEGSGCPLAMQIVDASLNIINNMLSFDSSLLDEEIYKNQLSEGNIQI